jgi:hypothetical protein
VKLDYEKARRRAGTRQVWVGIALWIVIALLLAVLACTFFTSRHDPNAWR